MTVTTWFRLGPANTTPNETRFGGWPEVTVIGPAAGGGPGLTTAGMICVVATSVFIVLVSDKDVSDFLLQPEATIVIANRIKKMRGIMVM